MILWFFNKVVSFRPPCWRVYSWPPTWRPKLLFCLYLVKVLIVTLRCAVNVATSYLTFSLNGVGLKNQIIIFFLRYDPPIVFRRQSHFITFIFIKTMSYDILVQMAYSSWIHIFVAFSLKRVTCKFKQFTNSEVQRSPWLVFGKPQFFHTFSVILILSNYRKCVGKPRFSKNWSRTSLRSRFSVLFLWTRNLIFSKREHQQFDDWML